MAEAALISPPSRSVSTRPPLSLMYLATYNEQHGIPTDVIDVKAAHYDKEKVLNETIRRLKHSGAGTIGMNCYTPEVPEVISLASRIKQELGKDIKIAVGGVHATLLPEDLLVGTDIDYAVMREGEITFANAIKAKDFRKVKGIAYAKGKNIVRTKPEDLLDLNTLPILDYSKIDMEFYLKPNLYLIRGIPLSGFFIFTSRGCPYSCRFCSNRAMFGGLVRYRNPMHVVDEIQLLKEKYKIDSFFVFDDTFTVKKEHVNSICNELIERKLGLMWGCQTRVNLINRDMVSIMKKAGCIQLEFGVESGSDRMLKLIRKGITTEQVKEAFKISKEAGMKRFANFMINLPGETKEDLQQTIALAHEIKAEVTIFNVTTPYPGSDLFSEVHIKKSEYSHFNNLDYKDMINYIDRNYHLAEYKDNLLELEQKLIKEFPSIHNIKLNAKTLGVLWSNLAFLFTPRYIRLMMKSERKADYLKFWLGFMGMMKQLKRD